MNFVYTESGSKELEQFQKQQQRLLEEIISSRKYVFGDDVVEVTRSDVQQAGRFIRPLPETQSPRFSSMKLAALAYIFVGLVTFVGGLAWPYLQSFYMRDRFSFLFSLAGLVTSILGYLLLEVLRMRTKRAEHFELMRQNFREASSTQKAVTAKDLQSKS